MCLIMFYDFIQALLIKRRNPTNNEHLPKHILFTTIYLLQEQKLNPINYSEHKIIMSIFV
jgi:hypothetical protein